MDVARDEVSNTALKIESSVELGLCSVRSNLVNSSGLLRAFDSTDLR